MLSDQIAIGLPSGIAADLLVKSLVHRELLRSGLSFLQSRLSLLQRTGWRPFLTAAYQSSSSGKMSVLSAGQYSVWNALMGMRVTVGEKGPNIATPEVNETRFSELKLSTGA